MEKLDSRPARRPTHKEQLLALLRGQPFRRVRTEPEVAAALAESFERGPSHLMDFLVLAGSPHDGSSLVAVQTLSDSLTQERQSGPMCFPSVHQPSEAQSMSFLRGAAAEEAQSRGCSRSHLRAHAACGDVFLPLLYVLLANAAVLSLWWWLAVLLLPGLLASFGPALHFWQSGARPHDAPPRYSVVTVAALLCVGCSLFLCSLLPSLWRAFPWLCALQALSFASNALCFWKTAALEAGYVPRGCADQAAPPERLCHTCGCVRPLRSKHDPMLGRCVRKFGARPPLFALGAPLSLSLPPPADHYCPLVLNAVGEDNQHWFVLFCLTMALGQAVFLRLGLALLAAEGEGPLHVLLRAPGQGFERRPCLALNLGLQCGALCFNALLCARALYGVAAELTSNEQINWRRYAYLQAASAEAQPLSGVYSNPFDRGVLHNTRRFFFGGAVDWDAELLLARGRQPPALSCTTLYALTERLSIACGWSRRRHVPQGHSHGGVPCKGDHQATDNNKGGEEERGAAPDGQRDSGL
jgi:hypothetical protein